MLERDLRLQYCGDPEATDEALEDLAAQLAAPVNVPAGVHDADRERRIAELAGG